MKWKCLTVLCLASLVATADANTHYFNSLNGENSLQRWWVAPGTKAKAVAGTGIEITADKSANGAFRGVIRGIPAKPLQGKRVKVSVDAKTVDLKPVGDTKTGGKFMMTVRTPGETFYPQNNPVTGTNDWKNYSFEFTVPANGDKIDFCLGTERGTGTILFRNLKVEVLADGNAHYFNSLNGENSLQQWWIAPGTKAKAVAGTGIEITADKSANGAFRGVIRGIPAKPLQGKRVKVSVDAKTVDLKPVGDTKTGGKFMMTVRTPGETFYPQNNPVTGTNDWKNYSFEFTVPANGDKIDFCLGTERGTGTILFRNLKVEILDTLLDLSKLMNMGYADPKAGDGKGGWSDQGPDNDARKFDFKAKRYANVPFKAVDPAKNNGKSVMTFRSGTFGKGLSDATLDLSKNDLSGKYLYLLHTLTYGSQGLIGTITVTGKNGETQVIEVQGGRDVNDWWMAKPGKNAHPASVWTNSSGGIVGVFVSVFPLSDKIGAIRDIRFTPKSQTSVWIVLAATLSSNAYEFPKAQIETTKINDTWKVFHLPKKVGVVPGSALDLGTEKRAPAGAFGRVIINEEGNFAFEKAPEKPVRFFAALFPNTFIQPDISVGKRTFCDFLYSDSGKDQKSKIHDAIRTYRHKGYNMLRMHFIDSELAQKKGLDFPADVFDNFFYALKCMKDNGIYLNLDIGSSSLGYYPGITWADWTWRKDHKDARKHIYFDKDSQENWKAGARKILQTVNPYTKMRLVDDPMLVCLIGYNEQEFVFSSAKDFPETMPRWKEFLKKKYGTIDRVKAAWQLKNDWKSFDDLPVFRGSDMMETTPRGRDAFEFTRMMEREILDFYIATLRELGWKGPVTNFNMGKSIQYVMAREKADFVAMNSYHAHPSNYVQPGSTIDQSSSIASAANVARGFYAYQMPGKPYIITEHGHVFWNRHRYEQAFVTDGYAALQGLGGVTAFIDQMSAHGGRNHPFGGVCDPIMYASEFLAYYIYARGDVREADLISRVILNEPEVLENHAYRWGLGSEQTRLVLLGRFNVENAKDGKPVFPLRKNEVALQRTGGSAVTVAALGTAGFSSIVDGGEKSVFNLDSLVRDLKKRGMIPADNRTDASKEIFESSTGELLLNAKKSFMSIDTKRLQGICGLAGTKAKLSALEILEMTRNGNLAAVSIDEAPALDSSNHLMVVYATDAVNSGMVFNDSSRRVMQKMGSLPVLYETGVFEVAIRNRNAANLKAFAVDLSGKRQGEIPVTVKNGRLHLRVDTAKLPGGPAVFFEIAEK